YFSAALLGGITPFCSCSTIPMLTGLLKAQAGFGPTVVFLFTSPLLNPIIIGLFLATFGLEVTLAYATIALSVSVIAGYLLERLNFARYIRPEVFGDKPVGGCSANTGCGSDKPTASPVPSCSVSNDASQTADNVSVACNGTASLSTTDNRWKRIGTETWSQFTKVLPYLLLGIAIGSFTYGFMPADMIAQYAGADNLLAIPLAAVIGVPLYIRAEAVIPLSSVLATKGMGMGAIMALIIGSAGASLTEVILLKSMFKSPMIIAFLVVIFSMAIMAGALFNYLF
ncbi:MAG: permease, partial [Oceanospirillaceae bacterium]|nr:permease [Oceanospirillaceae bacterium]